MTERTRRILEDTRDKLRANNNEVRAAAIDEVLKDPYTWIDCAERPPEIGKEVLFTRNKWGRETYVRIGKLDHVGRNGYGYFHSKDGRYVYKYKCKVWMPLPEPYIDTENDSEVKLGEW